jgi:archaeosine-15-forming tRNA-guanine transglycosylase
MSSSTSLADRRRAEIEAKRSKLAALKKQREERSKSIRNERLATVRAVDGFFLLMVAASSDDTRSAGYR